MSLCPNLLPKLCVRSFIILALVHWITVRNWTALSVLLEWSTLVHLVTSFKSLNQLQVLFGTYKMYHLITLSFYGYSSVKVIKNLYVVPDSLWIGTAPFTFLCHLTQPSHSFSKITSQEMSFESSLEEDPPATRQSSTQPGGPPCSLLQTGFDSNLNAVKAEEEAHRDNKTDLVNLQSSFWCFTYHLRNEDFTWVTSLLSSCSSDLVSETFKTYGKCNSPARWFFFHHEEWESSGNSKLLKWLSGISKGWKMLYGLSSKYSTKL